MTTIYPVGDVPYLALQAGGRRTRQARMGVAQRAQGGLYVEGAAVNLAVNNTIAATYSAGAGITAIGGQHDTANASIAPDGRTLAVRVRETATAGLHWMRWFNPVASSAASQTVAAIYVRGINRTRGRIAYNTAGDFSGAGAEADFDLVAGTITVVSPATATAVTGVGLERVADGWWRVWIAAVARMPFARVLIQDGTGATSYTGNTANGFDVYAASIEAAATPSPLTLTGPRPLMHPAVPQNWLVDALNNGSNTSGGWTLTNAAAALLTTARAPDGSFTAVDVTETTAAGQHSLVSIGTASALTGVVTFSVYARARGVPANRGLVLEVATAASAQTVTATFQFSNAASSNVVNSTPAATGGGIAVSSVVEYVTEDWVRCSITAAGNFTWQEARIRFLSAGSASYTGVATEGFHLWGAELTSGYRPTESWIQAALPDAALVDNGVRYVLPPTGDAATYADAIAGGGPSWYWEVTVAEMTTDAARVGFVRATSTAQDGQNMGSLSNTWNWQPNGNVVSAGVTVGTAPTYAQGDTLGLLLLWNATTSRYSFHAVKNPSGPVTLPAASVPTILAQIIPAVGRAGVTTGVTLDVNLGQRPFRGVPPVGFTAPAWDAADRPRSFSISSRPVVDNVNYRTTAMGTNLVAMLGRLAALPVFRRAVSCWAWGRDSRAEPVSAITLDNSDGRLDALVETANRDRTLALHLIPSAPFTSVTAGNRVATVLVDQVRQEGGAITIAARDLLELLTVPVQNLTFPDTTPNAAVRGKPRPIVLGNVRWAPVVMRDGPLLDFDVHESASFLAIDEVRQNGALLATPADYSVPGAGGAFGFRRATALQGKQCARVRGAFNAGPVLIERLPALLTWLAVTKTGRLTAAQLDTAGTIAALDTAAPYTLARYIGPDDQVMASALAQEIMDAFCGDLYAGSDGVLRAWRLTPPVGAPAFTWTEADLLSDVVVQPDQARGLTTTIGFAVNYCVHSTGEIAGAVQPTTIGSELSMPFQSRTATVSVSSTYRQAVAAPPLVTLLTDGVQAQAEIDRVASIYSVDRFFYRARVMVDGSAALAINPGTLVRLTVPAADLRQGKLLWVVAVEGELASNSVTVTLWG